MRAFNTLILLLALTACSAQTRLDSMIAKLKHADFGDVYQVKDSLVDRGKEAIPKLVKLLKDTSFVKLKNTADLIYPGANKFYGHGWIVNYDIDWLSVRAAWLLEQITFQNFGYGEQTISEDQLMKLHQQNYSSYLQTGSHSVDFKNKSPRQKLVDYRQMLADSVSKWWDKNQDGWTRFKVLKEALASSDEIRQSLALHFLRFGETKCEGLNRDSYEKELFPLVQKIRDSKNSKAQQAQLLLDDKEYYWLKSKR
jgi:hypothetical protein